MAIKNQDQTTADYEPFGPDWEKYMMTLPKKFIIALFKNAQLKNKEYEEKEQSGNVGASLQKPSPGRIS